MTIDDLHRELGKALREEIKLTRHRDDIHLEHQKSIDAANQKYKTELDQLKAQQEKVSRRVEELSEASRLVEEGMDPVQAKLIAKESLEDQDSKNSLILVGNSRIHGSMVVNAAALTTSTVLNSKITTYLDKSIQYNPLPLGDLHGNKETNQSV